MPLENDPWHLKKHDNGEVFGPVPFGRIVEWAGTAQIAPQDAVSSDGEHWTKAPMVPELKMDWIVRLDDDHYYGPTTIGSLLEFRENGEINGETVIIDCCTAKELKFKDTTFFVEPAEADPLRSPSKGVIRLSLQKRIRDLEVGLLEKRRQLDAAAETIRRLETRVSELESRLRGSVV
jgi:hypothetical protein